MSKYKLVIFDFDGTLFATHEAIIHCICKTFEKFQKTIPSRDAIFQTIMKGIGLEDTFKFLNPSLANTDNIEKKSGGEVFVWIEAYREFYKLEGEERSKPFEHAQFALEYLHKVGIKIVIISNKGIDAINAALEKFKLKDFVSLVVGDAKGMKKKPDPMIFNEIIKPKFKDILPSEILMVGDTSADLHFGKNIGSDVCWAMYGYGSHEECISINPTYSVTGLLDINTVVSSQGILDYCL